MADVSVSIVDGRAVVTVPTAGAAAAMVGAIAVAGAAQVALVSATPGFDTLYPNAYASALPRGVMSGTIGGTAITGATPGTYALTAVGGSITGVEANLVVTSSTAASIVIVNPGLGTGTTPPTWANPGGATIPGGTTLTAVVAPRVATTGRYLALSADGLSLQLYQNDGTSTPAAVSGVSIPTAAAAVRADALRAVRGYPYVSLNFAAEEYAPLSLASMLTGTPVLSTVEGLGTRAAGAKVEEARTNRAWSTEMEGAAVGVIGSGGAYPTGWHIANSVSVASVEILSYGSGEINIKVTPDGTSGTWILQFNPITDASVTAGQVWTGSVEISQTGTAPDVTATKLWMIERDGAGTFVASGTKTIYLMSGDPFCFEQRRTIVNSGRLTFGIGVTFAAAGNDPITLRIRKTQLEQGAFKTTYVASPAGAGARAAAALSITEAGNVFDAFPWSVEIGVRLGADDESVLWQADDGTANNRFTLFQVAGVIKLEVVAGGVVAETITVGQAARWRASRVAVTVQPGLIRASLNGAVVATGASSGAASLTRCLVGSGQRGELNGDVADISLYRRTLWTAAEVLAKATPQLAMYDNFNRSDRALITDTAPTGQVYGGVEAGENPSVVAPLITSGKFVADGTGTGTTAVYLGHGIGAAPAGYSAVITLDAGAGTDVAALISTALGIDDVADITTDSLHPVFGATTAELGYYDASAPLAIVGSVTYTAMTADGATTIQIGWRRYGDDIILEIPDGTLARWVNATASGKAGGGLITEIYRGATGSTRVKFVAHHTEL